MRLREEVLAAPEGKALGGHPSPDDAEAAIRHRRDDLPVAQAFLHSRDPGDGTAGCPSGDRATGRTALLTQWLLSAYNGCVCHQAGGAVESGPRGRCGMLQINVSQQLKGPVGTVRQVDVADEAEIAGLWKRVGGRLKLTRTDRGILAQGMLETATDLPCSRCLRVYACPLKLNIEEIYTQTRDIQTGAPLPYRGEPGGFTIDENNVIDLTEAVRQYAGLRTPMKPLCREDCSGLCARCGCNLNHEECGCPAAEPDVRWSVLTALVANHDRY